jgi:ArsR family transcriptional regulator, arsenate/arsenite/antimonite-responsive transcriptional repressor
MAEPIDNITEIAQALSDASRVRAVMALRKQELCVCQLIELLDLAPSTVSKHMTILKQAGLVDTRKEGRWVYYRLVEAGVDSVTAQALRWVVETLSRSTQTREDDRALREILATDLEEICCRIRS